MKRVERTNKFKKDYKTVSQWNNFKKRTFEEVVTKLQQGEKLDPKFKPHLMTASGVIYQGYWNIHVAPDVILICDIQSDRPTLIRMGSHNGLGITESLVHL